MTARDATGMSPHRCTFCGLAFSEGADTACGSCPLHRGECGLVKCPRCGYEFPEGSSLVRWFRKLLRRTP